MIELLLWLVLAHVAADFILQTPGIAGAKRAGDIRGYILHAAGHALALAVFTHRYISLEIAVLWIVLPVVLVTGSLKTGILPSTTWWERCSARCWPLPGGCFYILS